MGGPTLPFGLRCLLGLRPIGKIVTNDGRTAPAFCGRSKTAKVVSGNAFGLFEGVVVDTHGGRRLRRLGQTRHLDPIKVESPLVLIIPKEDWTGRPTNTQNS